MITIWISASMSPSFHLYCRCRPYMNLVDVSPVQDAQRLPTHLWIIHARTKALAVSKTSCRLLSILESISATLDSATFVCSRRPNNNSDVQCRSTRSGSECSVVILRLTLSFVLKGSSLPRQLEYILGGEETAHQIVASEPQQ